MSGFKPEQHLSKVQGRDYLEVKWRLVWLRDEHPEAQINTECVERQDDFALFRASVSVPGGGTATGYGSESAKHFREYIEKAETKALGRALAALGYGTQFCEDYADADSIADAPVERPGRQEDAPAAKALEKLPRPTQIIDAGTFGNACVTWFKMTLSAALRECGYSRTADVKDWSALWEQLCAAKGVKSEEKVD